MIADDEALEGRKNLIILIMKDKLKYEELTPKRKRYVRYFTYIKASGKTEKLMKRIRYFI